MESALEKGYVKNGGVEIDELEAKHFERERIFVIFVRLLVFELGQFQREAGVNFIENHDDDQIQNGGRNAHDHFCLAGQSAYLRRRRRERRRRSERKRMKRWSGGGRGEWEEE